MTRRALVVANDAPLRGLLSALLQREELTVSGASTSDEALEQLSNENFEVIVVDLMMPDRAGYQVLHHVRDRRPEGLTCLIVITSEVTTDLIAAEGNDSGFHILRKPFEMTAFQDAVRTCLGQERGERPIGVQCLSCDRQESFKAAREDLAVQLARSEGWHVVTFVRPDPVTMQTKTLFITFCPTCAAPVRSEGSTGRRADGPTGRRGDGATGRRADGPTGRRADGPTGRRGEAKERG